MKKSLFFAFLLTAAMAVCSCGSSSSKDIELKGSTVVSDSTYARGAEIIQIVPGTSELKWSKCVDAPALKIFTITVLLRKNADIDTLKYQMPEEPRNLFYTVSFKDIDGQYINFPGGASNLHICFMPGLALQDRTTEEAKLWELFNSPIGTEKEITFVGATSSSETDEYLIDKAVSAELESKTFIQEKRDR